MPFTEEGFELILNRLTDSTDGINKIRVSTNLGTYTPDSPTSVTFGTASVNEYGGTISANNLPAEFIITNGTTSVPEEVQAVGIYNDSTQEGYSEVTAVSDTVDYKYIVDTLTISVS